jgi:hypothetical protein
MGTISQLSNCSRVNERIYTVSLSTSKMAKRQLSLLVFERHSCHISAQIPDVLTKHLHNFPQSLQANSDISTAIRQRPFPL